MWEEITYLLSFTGVEDKTVWQDVFISSILIPIILILLSVISKWINKIRPSRQILKGYFNKDSNIYIFHSPLSAADDNYNLKDDPKYITRFPQPTPTNHANLGIQKKRNIDPVSSGADSECVATIFNILGLVQKTSNIHIGELIYDWNVWASPMFSVGFNPKTDKLIGRCEPIFFELAQTEEDFFLKLKNFDIKFGSIIPNDAGVIQKTFDKEFKNPVFILAGLGTMGTCVAGHILKKYFVRLGKLYGNDPFAIFFTVKTDEGISSGIIKKIYPAPKLINIIFHPMLYIDFNRKGFFSY